MSECVRAWFLVVSLSARLAWSVCIIGGVELVRVWSLHCGVLVLGPRRVCGDVEDGRR